MDEILVSISCITYNHEPYIADAIESFLMQKTNFKYEILIHDDASTDRTAEIIKKYQKKYPDIIKPIYQTENQYSKGIKVGILNHERAIGKYIAICEGDDYWTDPHKLQKQVDYMESHSECSMCFHDSILVDEDKSYLGPFPGQYSRKSEIKDIKELHFIPTASKLYRKWILDEDNIPEWYYKAPHGDFASMLICSNYGYIYYINEKMSAYRTNVPVSIMYYEKRKFRENPNMRINQIDRRINELLSYNKWSNYINDKSIKEMILNEEFKKDSVKRNFRQLRNKKYKPIFENMKFFDVFKTYARCFIPYKIYLKLHEVKNAFFKFKRKYNLIIKK